MTYFAWRILHDVFCMTYFAWRILHDVFCMTYFARSLLISPIKTPKTTMSVYCTTLSSQNFRQTNGVMVVPLFLDNTMGASLLLGLRLFSSSRYSFSHARTVLSVSTGKSSFVDGQIWSPLSLFVWLRSPLSLFVWLRSPQTRLRISWFLVYGLHS